MNDFKSRMWDEEELKFFDPFFEGSLSVFSMGGSRNSLI